MTVDLQPASVRVTVKILIPTGETDAATTAAATSMAAVLQSALRTAADAERIFGAVPDV